MAVDRRYRTGARRGAGEEPRAPAIPGDGAAPGSASTTREWLESIPAIAWRTDEHAVIVERNRQWFEYTGQRRDAVSGTDWAEVLHPDDVGRAVEAVAAAVATGGPLEVEFRVRRFDGVYRWYLGRALPVRDAEGRVTAWMGIGTDIEDRRRAEEALREADRRKNEFLGVLSHELRNPLAPIASATYILEHVDPACAQARRAREVIARQTAHLGRLVDDLLDVTRIVRGKIELRRARVDLGDIASRAGEDHRALLEAHGLALTIDRPGEPLPVDGDATRIAQIAGNLLVNAARFTPRGGRVLLSVAARGDQLDLRVQDDGPGIPPDLLPHVFEPFTQGPQGLARSSGGLGLGLALVKGLAELHGGTARAVSGLGQGAEIIVSFPRAPGGAEERCAHGAAARAPAPG